MELITTKVISGYSDPTKSFFCELSSSAAIICNGIEKFYHLYILRDLGPIKLFDVVFLISFVISISGFVFTVFYCALEPGHETLNTIWVMFRHFMNKCRGLNDSPQDVSSNCLTETSGNSGNFKKQNMGNVSGKLSKAGKANNSSKKATLTLLEELKDASKLDTQLPIQSKRLFDSTNHSNPAPNTATHKLQNMPEIFDKQFNKPPQHLIADINLDNVKYVPLMDNWKMNSLWCDKYGNVVTKTLITSTNTNTNTNTNTYTSKLKHMPLKCKVKRRVAVYDNRSNELSKNLNDTIYDPTKELKLLMDKLELSHHHPNLISENLVYHPNDYIEPSNSSMDTLYEADSTINSINLFNENHLITNGKYKLEEASPTFFKKYTNLLPDNSNYSFIDKLETANTFCNNNRSNKLSEISFHNSYDSELAYDNSIDGIYNANDSSSDILTTLNED